MDEIVGLSWGYLEAVSVLLHVYGHLSGRVNGVALHAQGVHSEPGHAVKQFLPQCIVAGARDQHRMQAERLQVTRHVEGRASQYGAVGKPVRQDFAEQCYGSCQLGWFG